MTSHYEYKTYVSVTIKEIYILKDFQARWENQLKFIGSETFILGGRTH